MANIIGISAFYHDAAVCLLQGNQIVCAAQEERFTRRKFEPGLGVNAIRFCLEQSGLSLSDIDCIAYYEDPTEKLSRIIASIGDGIGSMHSVLDSWSEKMSVAAEIRRLTGFKGPIKCYDHHLSHAASSFYLSAYPQAAILVTDGVGEWATTSFAYGDGKDIKVLKTVEFPHSLGLYYSAVTAFLGFRPNSDEYKVMGMAAYGEALYVEPLRSVIALASDGSYRLDMDYFDYNHQMFSSQLSTLLAVAARKHSQPLEKIHFDLAASAQYLLEQSLLNAASWLHQQTGSSRLCLAGGVALNCLANARLRDESDFDDIFVQPASGDAGGCFGAAICAFYELSPEAGRVEVLAHMRLGPSFDNDEIGRYLDRMMIKYRQLAVAELIDYCVERLVAGDIIGWFQGAMEFGPRALGGRSMLADPRSVAMKEKINALIKQRESFRPFAPICIEEAASQFFAIDRPYPFMTFIVDTLKPQLLGAITHDDGTARLQTVSRVVDPLMHRLLQRFGEVTGVPVLLNTSFNVAGEPIVCSPQDAYNCFRESGLDVLVMESCIVTRCEQDPLLMAPGTDVYRALAREVAPYLKDTYFFS